MMTDRFSELTFCVQPSIQTTIPSIIAPQTILLYMPIDVKTIIVQTGTETNAAPCVENALLVYMEIIA